MVIDSETSEGKQRSMKHTSGYKEAHALAYMKRLLYVLSIKLTIGLDPNARFLIHGKEKLP
jgi:hypothetical protein